MYLLKPRARLLRVVPLTKSQVTSARHLQMGSERSLPVMAAGNKAEMDGTTRRGLRKGATSTW